MLRNLAAGIFGCILRRLEIVYLEGDQTLPPPSNAREFYRNTLVVGYPEEAWELRGLVTLRVDHAVLTGVGEWDDRAAPAG